MVRIAGGKSAAIFFVLIGLCWPAAALAQVESNQVMVPPFSQRNPALPHPAHEGARITLKAVVRNATCGGDYRVTWDVNRNQSFNDDYTFTVRREGATNTVRDAGRIFEIPNVDHDTAFNMSVRVVNTCNGEEKFATQRIFIYDWRPSNDPRNWTHDQVEIMGLIAVNESLWYLHRTQSGRRYTDTRLDGYDQYSEATGISAWLFAINGHLPAYPPQHLGQFGNAQLPDGWVEANNARWNNDPYAETTMRFMNYIARSANTAGIDSTPASGNRGEEEDNSCGWNNDGSIKRCDRLPGTTDNRGTHLGSSNIYRMGLRLGGLAPMLPALAGTPIRVGNGNIQGQTWEWLVQQTVDYLGYQQYDGGCARGGWLYGTANGSGSCSASDGSTSQWAYIGLESSEIAGGPYGIFVNNRHKYRIADNLVRNQRGDGGAGYRSTSGRGDLKLTGGSFVGARWLGIHQFARDDDRDIFTRYSDFSAGRLRQAYDTYLSYAARVWNETRSVGGHWQDSLWEFGDYLCGNRNAIHNVSPRCGSSYAMYSLQKGFRTGQPELERVGNHDWFKEFTTYYVRAMNRGYNANSPRDGNYSVFGRVKDEYCRNHSVTCSYGGGRLAAPMGGLVLTPTIFNPKPVAIGTATPAQVTEGCAGGNAGQVTFDHGDSFHPSADGRIVAIQWDVDASNGLWWDTGAQADYVDAPDASDTFVYTYLRAGDYTATLRVVDHVGQTKTTTVQVRVVEAQNEAPSAVHGGPYILEIGEDLRLRGQGSDVNLDCGDRLTIAWDLDNDGQYDDANGATPVVAWAVLQGFPRQQPLPIRIRVRDDAGEEDTAETTLTIYPREPIARGRANPNPASCPQEVIFDGSASTHPNPARTIAQYAWDVDGVPGFDGQGRIYRHTYDQFGTYPITLRVTDDAGRTHEVEFEVEVNQGNEGPVARVSTNNYVLLEGDDLTLDGRQSSDANVACGDRIEEYAWDLDGDGQFDDAAGPRPQIPWATAQNLFEWPADRDSGEPSNPIRLRVTDTFGEVGVVDAKVTIFAARPIAEVSQTPDPAPINLQTGFSNPTFDARESRSPVPGIEIAGYYWDWDNDAANDAAVVQNPDARGPVVEFIRVFNPVPRPDNLPQVRHRLVVVDADGRIGSVVFDVHYRVPPTPPTADADPTDPPERGYHYLVGENVELDGSQSFDPDEEEFNDRLVFYRWDLTYDENDGFAADFENEAADANDEAAARQTVTPAQLAQAGIAGPGNYTVAIEVEDTTNLTNIDVAPLNIYAVNPVAAAEANPNPAGCRDRVSFDGRGSNHPHPGIDVVAWRWDFDGDGQVDANGAQATHAFPAFSFDGPFEVALEVEDSRGHVGETTIEVTVNIGNRAPTANAGGFRDQNGVVQGPYAIAVGESLQLDAAGSSDPNSDCGDAIVTYRWDVGDDGRYDVQGDGPRPPVLSWNDLNQLGIDGPGQYDIELQVTDRFGLTQTAVQTLVVAVGPAARASANPGRAGCSQQVTFDGSQSSTDGPEDQGFRIVDWAWDFDGDGQFDDAEGAQVVRAVEALPDDQGNITVTARLRVTDEAGRTAEDDVVVEIQVQNLPPTAEAGGPYATGRVGNGFADVRLDGRGSSDANAPCDAVAVYKWDTDGDGLYGADDNPDDLVGAQVNYNNPNWRVGIVDTVRLVVCDANDACSDSDSADIEVRQEAPPVGEIISPRADATPCFGRGNFDLVVSVSDPAGQVVTATVQVAGQVVGQRQIDTPDNGDAVQATIAINANLVPEGRHVIEVLLDDGNGGESRADSGGRVAFDRTAPDVTIGNQLAQNVCYAAGQIPVPTVDVEDNLDAAPQVASATVEDGCGRILRVTATDACGNEGVAERQYLLAQQPELVIDGADEGELVAEARMSWEVVGPAGCGNNISATLSRGGGAGQGYQMNAPVQEAGDYTLTVSVNNCQGVRRDFLRNFSVNAPPVAVSIPNGHPAADPDVDGPAYIVAEGTGLQVDGSESLPPEDADEIARYDWDFDGDGDFDAQGELADFPTDEDGVFRSRLQVTDGLGASSVQDFTVTVTDVDPIPDAAGPYTVAQGADLVLDGSGSRAGSAADPIALYEWDFDFDGNFEADAQGADLSRPTHSWENHGVYTVRLRVTDEDSSATVDVRVTVEDVDPQIAGIDAPEDPFEIRPMRFEAQASAGAPGDPITRYEWDFDNDGLVDVSGPDKRVVDYQFLEAGEYTVSVRVRDIDSSAVTAINVNVRRITIAELLSWILERVEGVIGSDAYDLRQKQALLGADQIIAGGLWGEDFLHHGTSFLNVDKMLVKLRQARSRGVDLGLEIWAMSRSLRRSVEDQRQALLDLDGGPAADHPSMVRAEEFIEQIADRFDADEYYDDARSQDRHATVQALMADAVEGQFWLFDAAAAYNQYGRYELPDNRDPVAVSAAGDELNTGLAEVLQDLQAELQDYVSDGGNERPGPARAEIQEAIQVLAAIRDLQGFRVINPCPDGARCVTDGEALQLELVAMDLVRDLDAAANRGAYSRIWQQHLVLMLKFRLELSILRVEFVCGANSQYSLLARERQATGLRLVEENRPLDALAFYIDDETRCLMIDVYNGCLSPQDPEENPPIDVPAACEQ